MTGLRLVPRIPPALVRRRALVVEGDFPLLSVLRESLVTAGIELHCAAGAEEVRRLLARYMYDVVITDLRVVTAGAAAAMDVMRLAKKKNPMSHLIAVAHGSDVPTREFELLGAAVCHTVAGNAAVLREQIDAIVRTRPDVDPPPTRSEAW
jgi:DNA-binding response OmpR family regulator